MAKRRDSDGTGARPEFHFRPLAQADAEAIARWHYPEPFSFYDWAEDPDDLAELLDPAARGVAYFAVDDEAGELSGYFSFKPRENVYERVGFARFRVYTHETNGGKWEFVATASTNRSGAKWERA